MNFFTIKQVRISLKKKQEFLYKEASKNSRNNPVHSLKKLIHLRWHIYVYYQYTLRIVYLVIYVAKVT